MYEVLEGAARSPAEPRPRPRWGWPFTLWWLRTPVLLAGWCVSVIRAMGAPIVNCAPDTICPDMSAPHALVFGVVFAVPVLLVLAPVLGCLIGAGWGVASLFFVHERPSITVFGGACLLVLIAFLADRYRFRTRAAPEATSLRGYRVRPPWRLVGGPLIGLGIALLAAVLLIGHYRTAVRDTSAHLERAVLVKARVTQVSTDPIDSWIVVLLPSGTQTRQFDTSANDDYAEGDAVAVILDPADPGWDRLGPDAPLHSWTLWLVTVCLAVASVMIGRWLAIRRFVQRLGTGTVPAQPVVVGFRRRAAYLHDFPPAGGSPIGAFAALPHRGPLMITAHQLPAAWTRVPEVKDAPARSWPQTTAPGVPLYGTPPTSDGLPPYGYGATGDEQRTTSGGFSEQRPDPWALGPAPIAPWQETWGAALAPLVPAVFVGSLRPGGRGVLIAGDTIWWPKRPLRRLRRVPIWSRTAIPIVSSHVSPWPPPPAPEPRGPRSIFRAVRGREPF